MHVHSLWVSYGSQNKRGFYLSTALNSWKRSVLYAIRNEFVNGNYANVRQRSPAFGVCGLFRKFAKTLRSLYANSCTSGYRWLRKYRTTNNVIS
jgi:hypothetical protein